MPRQPQCCVPCAHSIAKSTIPHHVWTCAGTSLYRRRATTLVASTACSMGQTPVSCPSGRITSRFVWLLVSLRCRRGPDSCLYSTSLQEAVLIRPHRIGIALVIAVACLWQECSPQSSWPPWIQKRWTSVSAVELGIRNDGLLADELTSEISAFSWPRGSALTFSWLPWSVTFGCLKSNRPLVSSSFLLGPSAGEYFNQFVPGTVGDPQARPDTAFDGPGWKVLTSPGTTMPIGRSDLSMGAQSSFAMTCSEVDSRHTTGPMKTCSRS